MHPCPHVTSQDALSDRDVYAHFQTLVARAKKFAKPEMKSAVEEWEAQLALLHGCGADDADAAVRYVRTAAYHE